MGVCHNSMIWQNAMRLPCRMNGMDKFHGVVSTPTEQWNQNNSAFLEQEKLTLFSSEMALARSWLLPPLKKLLEWGSATASLLRNMIHRSQILSYSCKRTRKVFMNVSLLSKCNCVRKNITGSFCKHFHKFGAKFSYNIAILEQNNHFITRVNKNVGYQMLLIQVCSLVEASFSFISLQETIQKHIRVSLSFFLNFIDSQI